MCARWTCRGAEQSPKPRSQSEGCVEQVRAVRHRIEDLRLGLGDATSTNDAVGCGGTMGAAYRIHCGDHMS